MTLLTDPFRFMWIYTNNLFWGMPGYRIHGMWATLCSILYWWHCRFSWDKCWPQDEGIGLYIWWKLLSFEREVCLPQFLSLFYTNTLFLTRDWDDRDSDRNDNDSHCGYRFGYGKTMTREQCEGNWRVPMLDGPRYVDLVVDCSCLLSFPQI